MSSCHRSQKGGLNTLTECKIQLKALQILWMLSSTSEYNLNCKSLPANTPNIKIQPNTGSHSEIRFNNQMQSNTILNAVKCS